MQQAPEAVRPVTLAEVLAPFVQRGLTEDEKFELVAAALGLCEDCRRDVRAYLAQGYTTLGRMVREQIWKWFGEWRHGESCTP